jgi:hypothetical protein
MGDAKFIDKLGSFIALFTLCFSFYIFFSDTDKFLGSLIAAVMASALAWGTYIIIKWLMLANRS